jgi:hypothetical protein
VAPIETSRSPTPELGPHLISQQNALWRLLPDLDDFDARRTRNFGESRATAWGASVSTAAITWLTRDTDNPVAKASAVAATGSVQRHGAIAIAVGQTLRPGARRRALALGNRTLLGGRWRRQRLVANYEVFVTEIALASQPVLPRVGVVIALARHQLGIHRRRPAPLACTGRWMPQQVAMQPIRIQPRGRGGLAHVREMDRPTDGVCQKQDLTPSGAHLWCAFTPQEFAHGLPRSACCASPFGSKCASETVQGNAEGCGDDCKKAQKCISVPKKLDKKFCCGEDTDTEERTGDHLVEVTCFTQPGGRGGLSGMGVTQAVSRYSNRRR